MEMYKWINKRAGISEIPVLYWKQKLKQKKGDQQLRGSDQTRHLLRTVRWPQASLMWLDCPEHSQAHKCSQRWSASTIFMLQQPSGDRLHPTAAATQTEMKAHFCRARSRFCIRQQRSSAAEFSLGLIFDLSPLVIFTLVAFWAFYRWPRICPCDESDSFSSKCWKWCTVNYKVVMSFQVLCSLMIVFWGV